MKTDYRFPRLGWRGPSERMCRAIVWTIFAAATAIVVVFIGVAAWAIFVEPGVRQARYERVHAGMGMSDVRAVMGAPRREDTGKALGPDKEHVCPAESMPWDPPASLDEVRARAATVWWYSQVNVVFDSTGHAIAKSGKCYFD